MDTHNYVTVDGCVHHNSGKTTGLFFKLAYMASLQAKGPDGIRRTRAVVVRNTAPQLNDTTLVSWNYWFKDGQAGKWLSTIKTFVLRFGDVECEVLFRPLDTPDDVARVLSLEVTFAIIDEFVQIPKAIVDALSARLGRFPAEKDGGATNWGMWGSSNPSTEDNWWFDHLHGDEEIERYRIDEDEDTREMHRLHQYTAKGLSVPLAKFFVQPSGFSEEPENWQNLPGKRDYWAAQARGKSDIWVNQFIKVEWGFSISGKPVIQSFKDDRHVAKGLLYNPLLPLVVGLDPGLAGSAMIFGQQDHYGRVLVLGELCQSNMGAKRLINERLKPYLNRRFPGARVIIAPDPAAANRSQTDERTVVMEFEKHYEVRKEANNRLPLRVDAIDHFCNSSCDLGYNFRIDAEHCPITIRALKGGWRWTMDLKKLDTTKGAEPEKNSYSHAGDACGYLTRFFHRQTERELRYSGRGAFKPPVKFGSSYHFT